MKNSLSAVKKWRNRLINGRITVEDDHGQKDRLEAIFMNLYGP
jgi:hypothetical protein